tara:strand:+ start:16245 stop:16622 length:378 start_codon:yes stop_codon:yes gene_type:complete
MLLDTEKFEKIYEGFQVGGGMSKDRTMDDYLLEEQILDKLDVVSVVKLKPCGNPLILEAVGAEMRTLIPPDNVKIEFTLNELEMILKYIQVPQWVPNHIRPLLRTIRAIEAELDAILSGPIDIAG